jgi:hypothetical protein
LLEKLCRNLGWEIVPTDAQRLQSEIDESDKGSTSTTGRSEGGNTEMAPSGVAIMAFFTVMAVMCVGGYFLLMKLIDISRLEDCMMQGRRNCMPSIELPARRQARNQRIDGASVPMAPKPQKLAAGGDDYASTARTG